MIFLHLWYNRIPLNSYCSLSIQYQQYIPIILPFLSTWEWDTRMAQPKFCVLLSSRSKEANMNEGKLRECARFDSQNKRECARTHIVLVVGCMLYLIWGLSWVGQSCSNTTL
jgi:hypothetical protein